MPARRREKQKPALPRYVPALQRTGVRGRIRKASALREQAREEKGHLYRKERGKAGIRRALRLKVVFDTNIFISAFVIPGSKAEEAYRYAIKGEFSPVRTSNSGMSDYLNDTDSEAATPISYKKSGERSAPFSQTMVSMSGFT